MNRQDVQRPILFYSSVKCSHSEKLLAIIQRNPNLVNLITFVDVVKNRGKLPRELRSVPTLQVDGTFYTEQSIMKWLQFQNNLHPASVQSQGGPQMSPQPDSSRLYHNQQGQQDQDNLGPSCLETGKCSISLTPLEEGAMSETPSNFSSIEGADYTTGVNISQEHLDNDKLKRGQNAEEAKKQLERLQQARGNDLSNTPSIQQMANQYEVTTGPFNQSPHAGQPMNQPAYMQQQQYANGMNPAQHHQQLQQMPSGLQQGPMSTMQPDRGGRITQQY